MSPPLNAPKGAESFSGSRNIEKPRGGRALVIENITSCSYSCSTARTVSGASTLSVVIIVPSTSLRSKRMGASVMFGQGPVVGLYDIAHGLWSPTALGVGLDRTRSLEERGRDLPETLNAVRSRKEGLVAQHHLEQEPLVRLEVVVLLKGVTVEEAHLGLAEGHLGTGLLREEVRPNRTGVLEVDDEFVGVRVLATLLIREDLHHGLAKSNRDELAALGQALAGAQIEGHAHPARVVDPGAQGNEGLGGRVRSDARLVEVPVVLAAQHGHRIEDPQRLKDLIDLVAQG